MDKSEGRSFFSKTISTVGDKVAKWYHTGNVKLSISSLKRARSEKVQILGNKVFELVSQGKPVTGDRVQEEYAAIVELDEQIKLAAKDLEKIQADGTLSEEVSKPRQRAARKPKTAAKADIKKTVKARKPTAAATAEKAVKTEPAKKTRAKKAASTEKPKKKAPTAKKNVPAVKVENKPAVRVENKPAVQAPEAEAKPKAEA